MLSSPEGATRVMLLTMPAPDPHLQAVLAQVPLHLASRHLLLALSALDLLPRAAPLQVLLQRRQGPLLAIATVVGAEAISELTLSKEVRSQLVVLQHRLAASAVVGTAEFELAEHGTVELVDLAGLGGEAAIVAAGVAVLAVHVQGLSAFEADDVLARLAFDWVDDEEFACWADEVLVDVGVREEGSEATGSGEATHGGGAHVEEAEAEDGLRFLDRVVDLALRRA